MRIGGCDRDSSQQQAATSFRDVTDLVRSPWIICMSPLDSNMGYESGFEQLMSFDGFSAICD